MDFLPEPLQQMLDTPLGPFLAGGIGLLVLLLILAAVLKFFLRPPPHRGQFDSHSSTLACRPS